MDPNQPKLDQSPTEDGPPTLEEETAPTPLPEPETSPSDTPAEPTPQPASQPEPPPHVEEPAPVPETTVPVQEPSPEPPAPEPKIETPPAVEEPALQPGTTPPVASTPPITHIPEPIPGKKEEYEPVSTPAPQVEESSPSEPQAEVPTPAEPEQVSDIPQKVLDLTPEELDAARRLWAREHIAGAQKQANKSRHERMVSRMAEIEKVVKNNPSSSIHEIANKVKLSEKLTSGYVEKLVHARRITATGQTNNRRYS